MLTRRGSILLTTAFVLAVISLSIGQIYTSLIALSVIGWLSTSWLIFIFRACALPHRIRMERRIDGKPMERNTGILGRNTQVKVLVQVRKLNIPHVRIFDFLPNLADLASTTSVQGSLAPNSPMMLTYTYKPLAVGTERFEGIGFELFDLAGLFYYYLFIRQPVERHILPASLALKQQATLRKPVNQLLQAGTHRHLVGGSSSELLEIRDYIEGDSLRRVAWKLSARRDKLLTKSYEQEVPIRAQIFMDASMLARHGLVGQSFFDRSTSLATSLARTLMQRQDPVGLSIFSGLQMRQLRPALGGRHWQRMQADIIRAADFETGQDVPLEHLVDRVDQVAQIVYPEIWRISTSARSWMTRIGRVFVSDQLQPRTWTGFIFRSLVLITTCIMIGATLGVVLASGAVNRYVWQIALGGLSALVFGVFLFRRIARLDPRRVHLARVVNVVLRGSLVDLSNMIHVDSAWRDALTRFLSVHHQLRGMAQVEQEGRQVSVINQLQRVWQRAIAQSFDPELFVLLIHQQNLTDHANSVLKLARMALARGHKLAIFTSPEHSALRVHVPESKQWLTQLERVATTPKVVNNDEFWDSFTASDTKVPTSGLAQLKKLGVGIFELHEKSDAVYLRQLEQWRRTATTR